MDKTPPFIPHHVQATKDDLAGNHGKGRYILLPGSDGRAKEIAQSFDNLSVKQHPRGHHLYLGTITDNTKTIDVAAISSGMGCASMEIILHELFHLGGKRFLRVGTAGSLQPTFVKLGDIINVQAAVRDEHTTLNYAPLGVPAVASFEVVTAILKAAAKLGLADHTHTGVVHCKSAYYAREFAAGPQAEQNKAYLQLLEQCDVLATEMETAALFIQSQIYNHQLMQEKKGPAFHVLSGAILGIVSASNQFESAKEESVTTHHIIQLALETIKMLEGSSDE